MHHAPISCLAVPHGEITHPGLRQQEKLQQINYFRMHHWLPSHDGADDGGGGGVRVHVAISN